MGGVSSADWALPVLLLGLALGRRRLGTLFVRLASVAAHAVRGQLPTPERAHTIGTSCARLEPHAGRKEAEGPVPLLPPIWYEWSGATVLHDGERRLTWVSRKSSKA